MSTTTFAEEQFDSSVGYFEGEPGKVLQDGKWTIIRKLGWGPRSSTWLAVDSKDPENIEAIKLFTVAASRESFANNECNVLQGPLKDHFQGFPSLRSTFYEESPKGRHLALVLHVLGPSLESFRVKTGGALPLITVKKIVADVLESLAILQGKKIVHGAVNTENILFGGNQQGPDIMAAIAASASAQAEEVVDAQGNAYKVVKSQPFSPNSVEDISNEVTYLSNFGYARSEQSYVSCKSDILALGATIYLLLTGSQLSTISGQLEDSLSASAKLGKSDIASTAAFIESLLAKDPAQRPSALDLLSHSWLQ